VRERPSLAGCRVLVTRAPDRAAPWMEVLEARGATVEPREVFILDSMAAEPAARDAVAAIRDYVWVLLTSVNGLCFFREALDVRGLDIDGLDARFGVVGPQTAKALAECGVQPEVVAERADSGGLADSVAGRIAAGQRVLIVRPEVSRPELSERLAAAGVEVDSVPFYRNRPAPNVGEVARELSGGAFDVAVFSSPTSFLHLLDAAGGSGPSSLAGVALVAIGETTADTIRGRGHEVAAVARQPTATGIADAVEEARSG